MVGGAAVGLVGFNVAAVVGTRHAEPGLLGAAIACIPIVLAVAGALAQHRRPARSVVVGGVIVGAGALAVTGWGRGDAIGVAMAIALIACEAVFTLTGAQSIPRIGAWSYSVWTSAVAAIVFAALSAAVEKPDPAAFASSEALAAIAYLGVVVTAIGFVLWFTGVERLGPSRAGLCAGVAPPASAIVGALVGGPLLTLAAWLGMLAIAIGLLIGFRSTT